MDEIAKRLEETSAACHKAYDLWSKDRRNADALEGLAEAVHELRKVASRLEIEMAASERDEITQRPIPIPPHRASRVGAVDNGDFLGDDDLGGDDFADGNRPHRSGGGHGGGGRRGPVRHSGGGPRRPRG